MSVVQTQFAGRVTLLRDRVENFDRYPFSLPAVRTLESIELHPRMTFLVGENGSGKSTLLEALAVALGFNPEGGSRNFNFSTRASHSELHEYLRIAKGVRRPRDGFFLRAESWFNVGTEIEKLDAEPAPGPPIIDSYGGRSLHEQSHGESFMALLNKRFGGHGLYLLDEPEAALSPARQIEALQRLHELVLRGSQFVVATHSPILMAYPDALILHCTPGGLRPVRYEDTEHFRITRDFLRDKVLDILMER
jgi:predicted ATPase